MDQTTKDKYETMLRELRLSLLTEMEQSREASAPVELNGAMGRISRADAMQVQQLALEMKRRRGERLQRIETAFGRMQDGTYGACCRCHQPISSARLEAFPDVVLCVRCAS